jgi:hypothetical protein
MNAPNETTPGRTKGGGWAALYLAAAYVLAIPFFLYVVNLSGEADPMKRVSLLASHHWSIHAMYLVTYVVFGVALAVVSLSLHERLKALAPGTMRVATAIGLLWAFVLVASGMVFNAGMAAVVDLHATDPAQAAQIWRAIEPVTEGLGGSGGELLGGLWVLLVSLVGLRAGGFSKPLARLGVVLGVVGLVSVVPPLNDAAIAFGMIQILWFVWLGITMLRTGRRPEHSPARHSCSPVVDRIS